MALRENCFCHKKASGALVNLLVLTTNATEYMGLLLSSQLRGLPCMTSTLEGRGLLAKQEENPSIEPAALGRWERVWFYT